MKYFVYDNERKNTVYHEFQKGSWDGHTYWKKDSIYLSDDLLFTFGIRDLFVSIIPNYNDYSEFEIDKELWNCIMLKAQQIGGDVYALIMEANEWVTNTYLYHSVFTIIGV